MDHRLTILFAVVLFPSLLAYCKEATTDAESAEADQTEAPNTANADEDVLAYAELCKQELGIRQPLPAMSCLSGTEVPITVDGHPLDETNYSRLPETGCDAPQWLGQACHNYDLVQKIDVGNPDVEAVLNCRQKYFTNPKNKDARRADFVAARGDDAVAKYRLLAEFNDLGFILQNKRTGKSCFFTVFGKQFNGAWLPPPDMRTLPPKANVLSQIDAPPSGYAESEWYRDARAGWHTPRQTAGGGCVGCHDLGAFKHSPFIDQVDVVPSLRASRRTPYLLVGNVFQEAFRSRNLVEITTEPVDDKAQRCTSCHRMTAGGETCNKFLDWSTGHDPSPLSASSKQWPNVAWMPFDHGDTSEAEFTSSYGKHIERMKCCCQKPNARGCKTRKFGPTADEMGPVAEGATLPDFAAARDDAAESCL